MDVERQREALDLLERSDIEVLGLLPYASNATLLVRTVLGDREGLAVYKPRRGERPLWDFPPGTLCLREVAAWVVSSALGWDLVPPTVLRDGPAGIGALQTYIEPDEDADVRATVSTHTDELRTMALFDVIVNNTDRKAGHLIIDGGNKLWGVDHGICFSAEPKLRTVIWAFEGESVPARLLGDLEGWVERGMSGHELEQLLDPDEMAALAERVQAVLTERRYPAPDPHGRSVPWPPW